MGASAPQRRAELVERFRELKDCRRCALAATRTNVVFGAGNADADLMFVGEAPGFHEDRQGRPFVGAAGKLLDKLLAEVGLDRERDTFIANVLKCRPPNNRDPLPEEIEACKPFLLEQVRLIEPRVICTLGRFATTCISGRPEGITKLRGRPMAVEVAGLPVTVYPIYHPAAGLRSGAMLTRLREDFQRLPELLAAARPTAVSGPAAGPSEAGTESAPAAPEPAQLGLFG
ncbi:MAG: uracil-DNA glycosylase [Thermoleophilaceae bacterium]|nr:uracil-DNA glycosylase [Thermoleophilaceae bacterium]